MGFFVLICNVFKKRQLIVDKIDYPIKKYNII